MKTTKTPLLISDNLSRVLFRTGNQNLFFSITRCLRDFESDADCMQRTYRDCGLTIKFVQDGNNEFIKISDGKNNPPDRPDSMLGCTIVLSNTLLNEMFRDECSVLYLGVAKALGHVINENLYSGLEKYEEVQVIPSHETRYNKLAIYVEHKEKVDKTPRKLFVVPYKHLLKRVSAEFKYI